MVLTPANWEAAQRAGDTYIFNNSPASRTTAFVTCRVAGSASGGIIVLRGKVGVRPVFTVTNTANVITNSQAGWYFENLEFAQQGASGDVCSGNVANLQFFNMKISDGGGRGILFGGNGTLIASEIGGVTGSGVAMGTTGIVYGNYIHDGGADGILESNTALGVEAYVFNILDTNAGRGIRFSGAATSGQIIFAQNTIYSNGNSGYEIADIDAQSFLYGNIFQNNGDAANEYNVEWVVSSIEAWGAHSYNCFNTAGTGGSGNLLGLTVNGTEITTNPLFTNASGGDFSLTATSPCRGTSFPGQFVGGPLGHLDMGAVQSSAGTVAVEVITNLLFDAGRMTAY